MLIIDNETLSDKDVKKLKDSFKNVYTKEEVRNNFIEDFIVLDSFYLTRESNPNELFIMENGNCFNPINIKLDENNSYWSLDELQIDAKVKSIDDIINKNFITLLGETYSFNNYVISSNKRTSIIKDKIYVSEIDKGIQFYSLGRYFPKEYANNNLDIFTKRIQKAKSGDEVSRQFYDWLINKTISKENIKYDYVCYVPTKSNNNSRFIGEADDCGLVKLEKDYDSIKMMNREDRLAILDGKYSLDNSYDITGKTILLIDDVSTTNATLTTITKLILDSYDCSVQWLTIGKSIRRLSEEIQYICPYCDSEVHVRINGSNGEWFLSCNDYLNCTFNKSATPSTFNGLYKIFRN